MLGQRVRADARRGDADRERPVNAFLDELHGGWFNNLDAEPDSVIVLLHVDGSTGTRQPWTVHLSDVRPIGEPFSQATESELFINDLLIKIQVIGSGESLNEDSSCLTIGRLGARY